MWEQTLSTALTRGFWILVHSFPHKRRAIRRFLSVFVRDILKKTPVKLPGKWHNAVVHHEPGKMGLGRPWTAGARRCLKSVQGWGFHVWAFLHAVSVLTDNVHVFAKLLAAIVPLIPCLNCAADFDLLLRRFQPEWPRYSPTTGMLWLHREVNMKVAREHGHRSFRALKHRLRRTGVTAERKTQKLQALGLFPLS